MLRGSEPATRFVPCDPPRRRRPGVVRESVGEAAARELLAALDKPLPERDRRIMKGEGTDETGLWIGFARGAFRVSLIGGAGSGRRAETRRLTPAGGERARLRSMGAGYLSDSHALLWCLSDDSLLSERARVLLAEPTARVLVDDVTLYESDVAQAAVANLSLVVTGRSVRRDGRSTPLVRPARRSTDRRDSVRAVSEPKGPVCPRRAFRESCNCRGSLSASRR